MRFTGTITPPESGGYTFSLSGFGDARLYLDGELVASFTGQSQPREVRSRTLILEGGRAYDIRVEYAATRRSWRSTPGRSSSAGRTRTPR